jgi:hypothetical protein
VCDHVANFSARGARAIELPEPPDIGRLFDLPRARPYVRMETKRAPIPCAGTWSLARPEPKRIPMSYSPPRWKQTKKGPREETWLLIVEQVHVTVTLPRGSYVLTASNRGNTVHDSRDDSRRPICEVRKDLARVLGTAQADAACRELATDVEGNPLMRVRRPKARKVRAVTAEEIARAEADRAAWDAADREATQRRAERKANPPAKDAAPKFEEMSAEAFAAFNAECARQSAQALAFLIAEPAHDVERVCEPRAIEFPAPFTE